MFGMGCQSGGEAPEIEPKTYHTNRVGVGERLDELGWKKLHNETKVAAFGMWDTFNGKAQRYATVLDLPREEVNCMSNKKAWSRGILEHGHADKIPPTFLELREAIEARDNPALAQDWHAGPIYLKLATGVEGKGTQKCDNLDDLITKWSAIDSTKYLAQKEILPPAFCISPQMPSGYKCVIRAYVLNGEGPKWYLHEAFYTKYAPMETPVIMPGHTSFYGRMIEDFPEGYLAFFQGMCEGIFGMGDSFQNVGNATLKKKPCVEAHYHIHGLDVVVDENWRPYTIEVNVYPSLKVDNPQLYPDPETHRSDRYECRRMLDDFYNFIVFPQLEAGQQGDPLGWIECWPRCPSQEDCHEFMTQRGIFEQAEGYVQSREPGWDADLAEQRMSVQHDLH
eukprot:TRINITY_DN4153_c0_g1_i4.p1 TRINITY_DN4153_c0_g1~~TRINITY_DN4153_c0_g1_i4.p1  ORF type:complete len:394 (+),score=99.82 TRINITY_DN4153_c0_g1_i4:180-1361(+)